jgi:two-component system nitrogen regulation sensor histidine kinase NtrY
MQESLLRELEVTTRLLDNGPRPSQNGSSENSFLDSSSSGMVELSIADTGPGLTDEMRDRLFLPYFSTKQRGTGLGLSIAAKIIQEHQGTIRAEKNFPTGARFILELKPASSLDDPQFTPTETTQLTAPNP